MPLSPKAERTRQSIFDTAIRLFAEKGYSQTTLRDIAQASGFSLGLTYRYYASKEDLVYALYLQLSQQALNEACPAGTIAERFQWALNAQLARLAPYREAMAALFSASLQAHQPPRIARDDPFMAALSVVVSDANDRLKEGQTQAFVALLYSTYILILLFWLLDRTRQQSATTVLIGQLREMYQFLRPALALPFVANSVMRLSAILSAALAGGDRS